jgi:monoamine oxidase
MSKSPLLASLRRALGLARIADERQIPVDEIAEWTAAERVSSMNRREFLGKALYGGAGLALISMVPPSFLKDDTDARIVIVGAGMAGLHAAYILKKHGIQKGVKIYEASNRTGGRMFTQKLNGNSGTTELGGEFIDSDHLDMRNLAREFGIVELRKDSDPLEAEIFHINGRTYRQNDAIVGFQKIREKVAADSRVHGRAFERLDNTSLEAYLEGLGLDDWFKTAVTVAYVGEYGLEAGEQSAVNFTALVGEQGPGKFDLFGTSDEAIKFLGGNQQICDRLAESVQDQIRLNHALVAIRSKDKGFVLTFEGETKEVEADVVIMTVPYSVLRNVDGIASLNGMTEAKLQCIRELGAGKNGKYFLDMKSRIWRDQGYQGYLYTNKIHTSWDSYHLQNGNAGKSIYTAFFGGEVGANVSKGGGEGYLDELSGAFPGFKEQYNDFAAQMNWWKYPWSLGSYICPRPGQYGTVCRHIQSRVGNMYFAGEHTSVNFGGFMNGAAESGRVAAMQVLKRVKSWG